MGSIAPSVLKSSGGAILGPFTMSGTSVDGLLYAPNAAGVLGLATSTPLCGIPVNKALDGDKVSLRVTGLMTLTADGVINAKAPVKVTTGGKVTTATVADDQVIGFLVGPASGADGDLITVMKLT
jgi:hypothetical protein